MKYYPFHIGDYLAHTRHLSEMEDLAYRRLLDWYYLNERPPNAGPTVVARMIGMVAHEGAVASVLNEFFNFVEGVGWLNSRAAATIDQYRSKSEKAAAAGRASAERRLIVKPAPVAPTSSDRSTDVEQTFNQPKPKPEPKENIDRSEADFDQKSLNSADNNQKYASKSKLSRPEDVSEDVWQDWMAHRRAKRAPVTAGTLKLIASEAAKAGWTLESALKECLLRGWQGFKAEWVEKKTFQGRPSLKVHMPNMPLGTPACGCDGCVAYRTKRAGQ